MSMHETSLKRTGFKWICKKRVMISAVVLIVPLIIFTAPLWISAGWHATHSSVQRYGRYKIRVPWPYFMVKDRDSAWLIRMRDVLGRQLYQGDVVTIQPGNKPFNINLWKKQAVQAFQQHRLNSLGSLDASFDASMGSEPVACIEMTTNKPEFKYDVECRGEDGTYIEYLGDGDGLGKFKSILSGITPVGK